MASVVGQSISVTPSPRRAYEAFPTTQMKISESKLWSPSLSRSEQNLTEVGREQMPGGLQIPLSSLSAPETPNSSQVEEEKGLLKRRYKLKHSPTSSYKSEPLIYSKQGWNGGSTPLYSSTSMGNLSDRQGYMSDQPLDKEIKDTLQSKSISTDPLSRFTWQTKSADSIHKHEVPAKDLEARKQKRANRLRPWTDIPPPMAPRNHGLKVEIHYEKCLPREKWVQLKKVDYAKNPKWGAHYVVKHPHSKPFQPETQDWLHENDFQIWLLEKSRESQLQLDFRQGFMKELDKRYRTAKKKAKDGELEWVGPHKDIYESYHHQVLERERQVAAAALLTRLVRGWLVRNRFKKLRDRVAVLHAPSWERFMHEYRGLMTRIQKRYGVRFPKVYFTVDGANRFLDKKEKYEKVFDGLAVSGKVPRYRIKKFFQECGLNPTEREVNTAFRAVLKGCGSKAEVVFLVDCSGSLGETNYRIQTTFIKELVNSLHVGTDNVRIGYVPYNTDVFESFGLQDYKTQYDVNQAIEKVKYKKGITRTDLALKKMRDMFQCARKDVPKTCIVITDGGSYASYATEKQARIARNEGVTVMCLGVGKCVDKKEILMMASSRDHIFYVMDYHQLTNIKSKVMKKADFLNCTFCNFVEPVDAMTDMQRALLKEEAMEILWMTYPPPATGLDPYKRSRWMKASADPNDADNPISGDKIENAEFDPCLKFVLKSKLEEEGVFTHVTKTGQEVEVETWEEALTKGQQINGLKSQISQKKVNSKEKKEKTDDIL